MIEDKIQLKQKSKYLANLLLAFSGIVIPFLALEACLRVINFRGMDLNVEMFKYASRIKRISSNKDRGHEHRPSAHAYLMGVDVYTNNIGLRDSQDFPTQNKNDRKANVKIAFVGDSFTMGWGVREESTIPELLEKKLNTIPQCSKSVRVFNLGVGNYNSTQELNAYKELHPIINPDAVLLLHFINDAEPYKQKKPNFLSGNSLVFNYFNSRLMSKDRGNYYQYYSNLYDNPTWHGNKASLHELNKLVIKNTGKPVSIYALPELRELTPGSKLQDAYKKRNDFFSESGFKWLDLNKRLYILSGDNPSKLWVTDQDSHSNEYANAIIANEIFEDQKQAIKETCTQRLSD